MRAQTDVSWPDILVGGLIARAVASAVTDADRRPALFRELRPSCADVSRRARFCGRGAWLPVPLGVGPALTAGFALVGALLAVMEGDGDGDGRAGPVPFVCMPGGIGRLAFPAGKGGGAAVATGPIASVSEGFARAGRRVRIGYPDRLLVSRGGSGTLERQHRTGSAFRGIRWMSGRACDVGGLYWGDAR